MDYNGYVISSADMSSVMQS